MSKVTPVRLAMGSANPLHREWEREARMADKPTTQTAFRVPRMQHLIELNDHATRRAMYDLFRQPVFHIHYGETLEQERQRTLDRWKAIADAGFFKDTISAGTAEGRARYEAVIESAGLVDYSLDIKMGVHYGLFGASIALLGTPTQSDRWLPSVESCKMLGCFALTELGHGSNARGIGTEARYNPKSKTFTLTTPDDAAQKYWIGGAFQSARWTVCFAQLFADGEWRGIHPFVVRLRADDGTRAPGVTLADCGHKCGLNGVGKITFTSFFPSVSSEY